MADNWIPIPTQGDISPVNPQTTIYLASLPRWSNDYKHVRLYDSKAAAAEYIQGISVRNIPNAAPVRPGDYTISVPYNEILLQNINYCIFRNTPYSNEWFFAFITESKWASPSTTVLTLELDEWQNNIYGATINPCYVERHHIAKADDIFGRNTIPENFELGDYVAYQKKSIDFTDNGEGGNVNYVGFYVTGTPSGDYPGVDLQNGIVTGARLQYWNTSNLDEFNELIQQYVANGRQNAIIAMNMFPWICSPNSDGTVESMTAGSQFGDYVPQNQKAFTYPYRYVFVDNNQGSSLELKYELSSSAAAKQVFIRSDGIHATAPAVYTRPLYYAGNPDDETRAIVNSNFPIVSWNTDTFQAYLAQNKTNLALSTAGSVASIAGGLATGNVAAAIGGITGLAYTASNVLKESTKPNTLHGKVGTENLNVTLNKQKVDIYDYGQTENFMRIIDSYWTAFGYPIRQITTPLINSRSTWNYIQTVNSTFGGTVGTEAGNRLGKIFDNGVTIWHTDDIGNYSLSNN